MTSYIYACTSKTSGQIIAMRFQEYRLLTKNNHDFDPPKIVCIALIVYIMTKIPTVYKMPQCFIFHMKSVGRGEIYPRHPNSAPISAIFHQLV